MWLNYLDVQDNFNAEAGFVAPRHSHHQGVFQPDAAAETRTDPAARADYTFSPRMTVRSLTQYNSATHEISNNIRYNFIHRPGSDAALNHRAARRFQSPGPRYQSIVQIALLLIYHSSVYDS